jgi:hypothetical protein
MLNASCPVSVLTHFHTFNATEVEHIFEQQIAASVVYALVLAVLSGFLLFFGKKLVKPSLFIAAFCSATTASFYFLDGVLESNPQIAPMTSCILLMSVPLVLGLLAGWLALCALQVGFALLGAGAGAGLGYLVYTSGLDQIPISSWNKQLGSVNVVYILCVSLFALAGMLLICKWETKILIAGTAFLGASGATSALALLLAHANIDFLGDFNQPNPTKYVWAKPLITVTFFVVGLAVQCKMEKKRLAKQQTTALRPAQVPLIVDHHSRYIVP